VKVRGFRIELSEIESALNQSEFVRESVVVAREDTPGEKCLVAYIVAEETKTPSVGELREFLRARLPDYMVPVLFVMLDALPLTPNRKVNRKALPPPAEISTGTYIAPRTPTEALLEGIWTQLLPIKRIDIHDKFFDVGGHSLLAIQVIARIRKTFKVELPLAYMFDSPTIAGMAEKIEDARMSGQGVESSPLVRVARDKPLKLSFAQLRLWFLNELDRGSPAYNIRMAVRLHGPLNVAGLEASLREIVHRHEVLRTAFRVVDGEPVQEVLDCGDFRLRFEDLSELPEVEREFEGQRLVREEAHLSFDLSQGPFLRATVMRFGVEDHGFVLVMHHIVSDGWSMGILFRELSLLYRAHCDNTQTGLSELPIQYADYAQWQRESISGNALQQQLDYWKTQLAGLQTRIELATDRLPRETADSQWGMPYHQQISLDLSNALRELSRREGVTLFMTLLAAFQILLFRHTGQDDVVVGTPVANRTDFQLEGLIGFFVNTLVMRNRVSAGKTFRETLEQVRDMCIGAYEHQDLPFEKLVEELRPERTLSHNAIFQIVFQLQTAPMEDLDLAGLRIEKMKIEGGMAKLDLAVNIKENPEGLLANFRYNSALFDRTTIARLSEHYVHLLESIVEDPQARVSELGLLRKEERAELLHEWNDTAAECPAQCIHDLIAAQAARTPEAPAVSFEGATLTYRELNEQANRLAHYLRGKGVRAEELVGICVQRSLAMVVGLLGILKAGGAYVPLDASYPRERLRYMIDDAGVRVLLTEQRLAGEFAESGIEVACVDTLATELIAENPLVAVSGQNLAYVIYTSGSTGVPKGVMIQHSSLSNFATTMAQLYHISSNDRVLQFASISFDTSAEEIYPTLLRGACLVLRSEEMLSTPEGFLRQCEEQGVTVLDLPTAYWHELVASGASKDLGESIRLVIIGGEKAQRERVRQWQDEVVQGVRLVNTYGPTEATVVATESDVADWEAGREVGIGRPLSNVEVYVLDERLEPVGVGITGELYIGGAGVARGYLGRAEQTAERFVPHPHSRRGGERLYRTGDLARYREKGELEYVGRRDEQVKVRGYRVELGEIEAVLNAHEPVRESVVVLRESEEGVAQLVAYVVSEAEVTVSELRRYVKECLPEYMVPGAFVKLSSLPLTANGKVDRRSLPAVDSERPVLDAEFVAPRNFIEEGLAAAWSRLLPVKQVGIHDNFFELGGHSILLTQLASRIRQDFQVELSLRALFTTPTIAELSKLIVARQFEQEDAMELSRMLAEVKQLSPNEVRAQLDDEAR
jgi:amino acid adenylation domain-containing protein